MPHATNAELLDTCAMIYACLYALNIKFAGKPFLIPLPDCILNKQIAPGIRWPSYGAELSPN